MHGPAIKVFEQEQVRDLRRHPVLVLLIPVLFRPDMLKHALKERSPCAEPADFPGERSEGGATSNYIRFVVSNKITLLADLFEKRCSKSEACRTKSEKYIMSSMNCSNWLTERRP